MTVSVSEEKVSGIDTHFRKYRIGGIDTFGIISPICQIVQRNNCPGIHSDVSWEVILLNSLIYI